MPAARPHLARLSADDPAFDPALARRCLDKLLTDYPTTPSATEARALLEKLDALPDLSADKPPPPPPASAPAN